MSLPKILYSTNVLLAYRISRKYYNDIHYVWCSDNIGNDSVTGTLISNPPSSQPLRLYKGLQADVTSGDLHSALISEKKTGIENGAQIQYTTGNITIDQRDEIIYAVQKSPITEFKPLIYVIPYSDVKHLVKPASPYKTARPTSVEYIIEKLPGNLFDIIDLG
jgi:hypothetical protein